MSQRQILIVTHDVVDENMAGPAIRCWEFARVLSRQAHVTLATPFPTSLSPGAFDLIQYDAHRLEELAAAGDVIILSTYTLWRYPFLSAVSAPLVVDLYDPFLLESLPLLADRPDTERRHRHSNALDALTDLLLWGDFFLCASERQRDYWLGWLNALDRINPLTYDDDPTLRRLIDVVAFGLPDTPLQHTRAVLKGVRPGIAPTDHVLLWAGGVYNWFDPLTLIRAMAQVAAHRDDVKLLFLGTSHPNPEVEPMAMAERAVALSQELGLYERCVFFNDWTPYNERQNYLLEADAGVSLHFAHLETHFSFRTRLLDHLWAGLPTIVTRGDVLADLVEQHGLGWVVGYEDVEGVAAAILESTDHPRAEFQARFAAVTPQLRWEVTMQPLLTFCREPHPAADRQRARSGLQALPVLKLISHRNALRRDVAARDERLAYLDGVVRDREGRIAALELEKAHLQAEVHTWQTQAQNWQTQAQNWQIETENLQQTLQQIKQGRVMRLMNGIHHILKGTAIK